jgi:hypothetical protein
VDRKSGCDFARLLNPHRPVTNRVKPRTLGGVGQNRRGDRLEVAAQDSEAPAGEVSKLCLRGQPPAFVLAISQCLAAFSFASDFESKIYVQGKMRSRRQAWSRSDGLTGWPYRSSLRNY